MTGSNLIVLKVLTPCSGDYRKSGNFHSMVFVIFMVFNFFVPEPNVKMHCQVSYSKIT